jgi:hypothetical protein
MQEFAVAFGRVTRAAVAANPELKNNVNDLLARAYFNIHGTPLTAADPQWVAAMSGAALQLCLDPRVVDMPTRTIVQLFENVVRISEEHQREARRHAAMASNVFYLKETALDALTGITAFAHASPRVAGGFTVNGRVENTPPLPDSLI